MPKKSIKKKEKPKIEKSKKEKKAKPQKAEVEKKEALEKERFIAEGDSSDKARYFEAIGRRKTAIARVRLYTKGDKLFLVNGKDFNAYFPTLESRQTAQSALEKMKCMDRFRIQVLVRGGGLHAQAEAVRHGISRALVLFNADFRKRLKRVGYLTRDPRMRERKKFGLKRARRAPQWQKR